MMLYQIWAKGMTFGRGAILILSGAIAMWQSIVQAPKFIVGDYIPWVPAAIVFAVLICLLLTALKRLTLPHPKAWTALGAATYPLYLLHNQPGNLILHAAPNSAWLALFTAIIVVAALTILATLLDNRLNRYVRDKLNIAVLYCLT
jgi:peptidoglycan/LPS O-acetylase OafA/YrhL